MDRLIEEKFIKLFISKRMQERLKFELLSQKKRFQGIDRFSHNAFAIIDDRYIHKINIDYLSIIKYINF